MNIRIGNLEVKGSKKKLVKVEEYFKKNNIKTLKDIENIKSDNIKVFQFWNETGVDIISLEINEYNALEEFEKSIRQTKRRYKKEEIIYEDIEDKVSYKIVSFIMKIVLLIGMISYLIIVFSLPLVRTI